MASTSLSYSYRGWDTAAARNDWMRTGLSGSEVDLGQ